MIPAWVVDAVIALTKAVAGLVGAKSDEERRDVLMTAQEEIKARLDALKFGS